MSKYLLLLKLDKSKLLGTIDTLRNLPKNPSSGVEIDYTMNIFGTWHVGVWFSSDKSTKALEFVDKKISTISGVADAFPVTSFPHVGRREKASEG